MINRVGQDYFTSIEGIKITVASMVQRDSSVRFCSNGIEAFGVV